ncbi:MAG: hypothetical protein ABI051_13230 [Vicinamibacterales bacterium]
MMRLFRRHLLFSTVLVLTSLVSGHARQTSGTLPEQLSDKAFWTLVSEMSEPSGVFPPSENFVSNERSFQQVVDALANNQRPASAYLGVGPEQNFTYIVALRPRIAFVLDIRRQNMLQHLMYKALFELSTDRADFLARLFSRPRPANLGVNTSAANLVEAFAGVEADSTRLADTVKIVTDHLVKTHGFPLPAADRSGLERVLTAFSIGGPGLTYDGPFPRLGSAFPTFGDLMLEVDEKGTERGFLATEDHFRAIQTLQKRNLLIPIVGDFAGPTALKAVGRYLREHDATVSAFYTSNVEQYLFLNNVAQTFYSNASTLPVGSNSVIIRSVVRTPGGQLSPSPAMTFSSHLETMLFPIPELLSRFGSGSIAGYHDVLGAVR